MKKFLLFLSVLCASTVAASAQDMITKKNGEDIKAKVMEVDGTNVRYKLFDEPDGATYVIKKSDILVIRYASGRNDIFNTTQTPAYGNAGGYEPAAGIRPGMKYDELKHIYNYREWTAARGNNHSPALMGVCSFFIPGLGQMISGEAVRGLGWLGSAIGCSVVGSVLAYYTDEPIFLLIGSVATLTVEISAIVDACRVAKVRNMYENDLMRANYALELHPSVDYIRLSDRIQPVAGVTLALKF